jgi:hypothetical protein
LLSEENPDCLPINILGGGRSVVGQILCSELRREEVAELINSGFLPLTTADEMPLRNCAPGLREIGLPYATDPAITKHLAAFLKQAALAMSDRESSRSHIDERLQMAKPDAVLFNGGFCIPAIARERITEAIANWFGGGGAWRPKILSNEHMSSAVAIGAAYYGRVRRGAGLRVKAVSARTYYIGMRSEHGIKAVCVLPSATNEGTTLPLLDREFSVLTNRPVSFHLYSSTIRHDARGAIADLDPEQVHRHAPLVTLLRYGKKLQQMELAARLSVSFTEVGTLELWCESVSSPHRWRLRFELRREASAADQSGYPSQSASTANRHDSSNILEQAQDSAVRLIRRAFTPSGVGEGVPVDTASLVGELESVTGLERESWPIATVRVFCDVLLEVADGRKLSPRHEVRDWITALLDLRELTHETASAVVQLGRRVDHRTRDISQDVVRSAIAALKSVGVADDILLRPLHEYIAPVRADVVRTFGEPIPKGLELESTASCLSSVAALIS